MDSTLRTEIENCDTSYEKFTQLVDKLTWWQKRSPAVRAWIIGCLYRFTIISASTEYITPQIIASYQQMYNTCVGDERKFLLLGSCDLEICPV